MAFMMETANIKAFDQVGTKAANIEIDRKVLADLVVNDYAAFQAIVAQSKDALAKKAA